MSDLIRRRAAAVLMVALSVLAAVGAMAPSYGQTYTPITGEGSSWASNAILDWDSHVKPSGISVNFSPTGSVQALNDYANGNSLNFAASDVPYGLPGGQTPGAPGRGFAYVPDVAGGTALMYNLNVGGQRFTGLKLSPSTIAGIFQGSIKSWNDPQIAASNPGVALPPLQITPVVRSDPSGATYQFTLYLSKATGQWRCGAFTDPSKCAAWANVKQQNGDSGVAGYISQSGNVGSIGYTQYSFALQAGFPAAKVLNASGFYVLPTASNVAVGLLGAKVNMDQSNPATYLTQDLSGVYSNSDQRAYPISSYSYFVVPTATTNGVKSQTGYTIAAYVNYALCSGQADMPTLGYSPLPMNLVQAGLDQVKKVPGAPASALNISNCKNNPTFSSNGTNTLALNALYPDLCDKQGAKATCVYGKSSHGVSSSTSGQGDNNAVGNHTSGSSSGSGGGSSVVGGGGGTGTSTGVPGNTTPGGSSNGGGSGSGGGNSSLSLTNPNGQYSCDPDTGQCTKLAATPTLVSDHAGSTFSEWAIWVALASLVALVAVPPISVLLKRRAAR